MLMLPDLVGRELTLKYSTQYVTDECAGTDPSVLSGCALAGGSINQSINRATSHTHRTRRALLV